MKPAKMVDKDDEPPKQKKSSWLVHVFVIFVSGLMLYFVKRVVDVKIEKSEVVLKSTRTIHPPPIVNRGVCVFISDAASGVGREVALRIAATGVHVLAGKFFRLPLSCFIPIPRSLILLKEEVRTCSAPICSTLIHSILLCPDEPITNLSCTVLSSLVLSYVILSFSVLSDSVPSCLLLFCPVLSCTVLFCSVLCCS